MLLDGNIQTTGAAKQKPAIQEWDGFGYNSITLSTPQLYFALRMGFPYSAGRGRASLPPFWVYNTLLMTPGDSDCYVQVCVSMIRDRMKSPGWLSLLCGQRMECCNQLSWQRPDWGAVPRGSCYQQTQENGRNTGLTKAADIHHNKISRRIQDTCMGSLKYYL
jgi:hypothetical protein